MRNFFLLFTLKDTKYRWVRRKKMKVLLNGELIQLPEHIVNVSDVLKHYEIHDKVIVVEINGEILTKLEHQNTRLADKDRIEIVHFVGGG
jgi:sulfur carrier protein